MATTSRRNRLSLNHDHSPLISERRRKLFPTDDNDIDLELDHIKPLCLDTSSDLDDESCSKILDYDIVGIVQNNICQTPKSNLIVHEDMSSLILSPTSTNIIKETPTKPSPHDTWKTPHDTSSKSNSVLKKEQKTLLEESKSLKRKSLPDTSPGHDKSVKLDMKNSKVRTALFPPDSPLDISLPTKSFYSRNQEDMLEKLSTSREKNIFTPVKPYTIKHNYRISRKFGQINNGVGHKIRKPKQRKISGRILQRTAKNFLNKTGDAIIEYIQDLSELKQIQQSEKLIKISGSKQEVKPSDRSENQDIITNESQLIEDDKENCFKHSIVKCDNVSGTPVNKSDKIDFDNSDFQDDNTEPRPNIEGILIALDTEANISSNLQLKSILNEDFAANSDAFGTLNSTPKVVLENQIQMPSNNIANMILSPISQMCDVTSGLALNSPKKSRNLTSLLNSMSSTSNLANGSAGASDMAQQEKMYPIFSGGMKTTVTRGEKRERNEVKRTSKRFKGLASDQMLLDAGQKKFGYTLCNECNTVYHMGDPGDEIEHINYHNSSHVLRFSGWKNEHVVADFNQNGRIIRVLPTDSKIWLKKVKDLMEVVKRDLGCYEMETDISTSQVFLFIKSRTIAGCVVATVPNEPGHRMLSTINNVAMCSEESYPIKCGISHIWVAKNYRKQGIATNLLNTVKLNFVFGSILTDNDIALTSPTEAGFAFAEKYFKTPNFLIYYI